MSEPAILAVVAIVTAIVAGLPPTLLAIAALRNIKVNTSVTEDTARKTEIVIEKNKEIHDLANSNLSKTMAALDVAHTEIRGLQALVTELSSRMPEQRAAIAEHKVVIADQKAVIAEEKALIADQKAVIADQKNVVAKQNGMIDKDKKDREP